MKKIILLVFLSFSLYTNAQNPLLWSTDLFCENINSGLNAVTKPVFDAQGNIYVAGSLMLDEEGNNRTPVVVKLNASGDTLWRYEQERPSISFPFTASFFSDIAIDVTGNIFALGIVPDTSLGINAKPIIVKIDPNGNLLWSRKMFDNIASENVVAGVLALDNQGSVYFTGRRSITFQQYNAFIWKYNSNGDLVWTHTYALNLYRTTYYNISLNTAQDRLYVNGDVVAFNGTQKLNLIEIINPSNGTVIKTLRNATTPYSETEALFVDSNHNVFVSLYDEDGAAVVKKYDDTLGLSYTYRYYPTGSYDNSFAKIIGGNNGAVYAAGYTYATSDAITGRAFYVQLSSEGNMQESFVFPSSVEEYIYDCVKVDDEIVFTGATVDSNNEYALKVWRLHAENGYVGNFVYNKPNVITSEGAWISDNNGDVFVTGTLRSNSSGGFSVLKLNPGEIITSNSKLENRIEFNVYPNPFSDHVQMELPISQAVNILVFNNLGQLVYQDYILKQGNSYQINLEGLPEGIYYLKVPDASAKSYYSKKIVKL